MTDAHRPPGQAGAGAVGAELAAWLRGQRETLGWSRAEMARQLIRAAKARGDLSMPPASDLVNYIYRWERATVRPSERYRLCYCEVLGIKPADFGTAPPSPGPKAAPSPAPLVLVITAHHWKDPATTGNGHDPFAVDAKRALDALTLAWADEYDQIWFHDGAGWGARHKDASEDDVITGSTPDELNAAIRADWSRRQGQP